jgi:hypothetical protein
MVWPAAPALFGAPLLPPALLVPPAPALFGAPLLPPALLVPPAPADGAPLLAAPELAGAPAPPLAVLLEDEQPSALSASTEKQLVISDVRLGMTTSLSSPNAWPKRPRRNDLSCLQRHRLITRKPTLWASPT